jgi:HK97 family phage prohead protease
VTSETETALEPAITFDTDEVAASFRVNAQKRTISGLVIPWGQVAGDSAGIAKWRFQRDSLYAADTGRVKLNLYHDRTRPIGRAVRLQSTAAGLDATFAIARGEEGDRALSLAEDGVLDGFSIEPMFEDGEGWSPDPEDRSVRNVTRARLVMVGLVPAPAFDDARVSQVIAAQAQKGIVMSTDAPKATELEEPAGQPAEGNPEGLDFTSMPEITAMFEKMTDKMAESIGTSLNAGIQTTLENIDARSGPESVKASRYVQVKEEPVYRMTGSEGFSLLKDVWNAKMNHDLDAAERYRKFQVQQDELRKVAAAKLSFSDPTSTAEFTTVTTTTAADVIPPGYRPDLYVPQLQQQRPLVNLFSRGSISSPAPFTVPKFGTATGVTGDHTEGSPATEGSITVTSEIVSPVPISGKLPLTREIVDSANPNVDAIALAALRESYAQQTEGKVNTLIQGEAGVQTSNPASDTGPNILDAIRAGLGAYDFTRFASPTGAALSGYAVGFLATAKDNDGGYLLPSVGPSNRAGTGTMGGYQIDTLAFTKAWALSAAAAGDVQAVVVNMADAWVFESPTLSFRFEEKQGPEIIELALFGYFGAAILRPSGILTVDRIAV